MRALTTSFAAILLITGCAGLQPGPAAPEPAAELKRLMAEVWQAGMRANPHAATYFGNRQFNDRHPDLSPEGIARRQVAERDALARLDAIDMAALDADARLNAELLRALLTDGAGSWDVFYGTGAEPFHAEQMPFDTLNGPQHFVQVMAVTPFANADDYSNYLQRLRTLDVYLAQATAQARLGLISGWTVPEPVARTVADQAASMRATAAAEHALYAPFTRMPASITEAHQRSFQAAARSALEQVVIPAYAEFERFLREDYLPKTRRSVAASALPDGRAYYDYCVRRHTTMAMSAEEIHKIGLDEVARLRASMGAVMREIGFDGDLLAFGKALREDPQFYYQSGEQVMDAHLAFAKRIDPLLTTLFGRLPRAPYGIKPMPEGAALAGGPPYYNGPSEDGLRPGYFFINTLRPELQPSYDMPALVAHEAVPGHHLQFALAMELGELPAFRRNAYFTAYSEGWALYAELLGNEVGMYSTPHERFGQLSAEIWRAIRLVVDTGMHAKGWSRQQAIDYFAANSATPMPRIVAEVDRYIGMPGQALGYKMGQLRISALRARAEQALGERFDVRGFHDEVLRYGPLPLDVLERLIDTWIAGQA